MPPSDSGTCHPDAANPRRPRVWRFAARVEAAGGGVRQSLANRARHLRRWPTKRGITCYRLYERDVADVPLVVDRYEDALHIAEFARPHDRSPAQHADWLDLMVRTAAEVLEVPRDRVFLKHRDRQRGDDQYQRVADERARFVVGEGGLKFIVNLSDYVDTGLFLDHRLTRQMVREAAERKTVSEFVCVHGLVHRLRGGRRCGLDHDRRPFVDVHRLGAAKTSSSTGFADRSIDWCRSDIWEFLDGLSPTDVWDLAVVDPPTFSNRKGTEEPWDVQRDHGVC